MAAAQGREREKTYSETEHPPVPMYCPGYDHRKRSIRFVRTYLHDEMPVYWQAAAQRDTIPAEDKRYKELGY